MKKNLILVFMFILSISTIVFADDLIDTTPSASTDLVDTQVSDAPVVEVAAPNTPAIQDTTSISSESEPSEDTTIQPTQVENTIQNNQIENVTNTSTNTEQTYTKNTTTTVVNTQDSNKLVLSQPNISTNTSTKFTTIVSIFLIILGITIIILAIIIIIKM